MPRFADPHRPEFIDRIVENARWRLGDEPTAAMSLFLRRYYERVPVEDIHRETPDTLFGAAFAHWRLAARRAPGTACLRVYNPRLEEDGWRSEHTVVEIVT